MQDASSRGQWVTYILAGAITGAAVGYALSLPIYAFGRAAEFRALVPAAIALIIGAIIGLAGSYGRRRLSFIVIGAALGVVVGMLLTASCAVVSGLNVSLDPSVALGPSSAILLIFVWVVTGLIVGYLLVLPIFQFGAGDNPK